jgi:hypothetical protein
MSPLPGLLRFLANILSTLFHLFRVAVNYISMVGKYLASRSSLGSVSAFLARR